MKHPQLVETTQAELDAIMASAKDSPSFTPKQYEMLVAVLGTYIYVMQRLQNAKISMTRFRHMLFGKSTENKANVTKAIGCNGVEQRVQADSSTEPAPDDPAASLRQAGAIVKERKKEKGHGRNGADVYLGATHINVELPELAAGDICPACGTGNLNYSPPRTIVKVVGQAPLAATVLSLHQLRCRLCDFTVTAPMPEGISPQKYDHSCASILALLHYGKGMPFHRLGQLQASMHVPVSASTQWDLIEKSAEPPLIVYGEMIRQAAQGEVLHNDDTPARVLALMGKRRAKDEAAGKEMPKIKAINTTGIVSLLGDLKIILFITGAAHAGINLTKVLTHRAKELGLPIQMCDALAANVKGNFKGDVRMDFLTFLALCLAHARRKFVEVANYFPEPCCHVIEVLADIYKHDAYAKEQKMSGEERLLYHQANSGPLMQDLKDWMEKQLEERQVEPNSGLGQAMHYMLRHWTGLTLFLRKAGAPIDNNICERAIKKAIIYRKNCLFYRSQHGADIGDAFMSLIHTCESCNANPFEYLQTLQKHADDVADNPHLWLPWNYTGTLANFSQAHQCAPPDNYPRRGRLKPPPAADARAPGRSPASDRPPSRAPAARTLQACGPE